MKNSPPSKSLKEILDQIKIDYLNKLPLKLKEINELTTDPLSFNLEALEREFHKLKGNGKTSGVAEISTIAALIEDTLKTNKSYLTQLLPPDDLSSEPNKNSNDPLNAPLNNPLNNPLNDPLNDPLLELPSLILKTLKTLIQKAVLLMSKIHQQYELAKPNAPNYQLDQDPDWNIIISLNSKINQNPAK